MRFLTRSLIGLFLFAMTLGLLGVAASRFVTADADGGGGGFRPSGGQARSLSVGVAQATIADAFPVVETHGTLASQRELELRAGVGGIISKIAPEFRDGGTVASGMVLMQIDPADMVSAVEVADIALAQAQADLQQAIGNAELAQSELELAQGQLDLQQAVFERQKNLRARGVVTDAAVESAQLTLSNAQQALLNNRQALLQAEATRETARISVSRAEITLREAKRDLADATLSAPFRGTLSNVTAIEGGRVSANERLATLTDETALEVGFTLTNTEFERIIDPRGNALGTPVTAILTLDAQRIEVTGKIERVGAAILDGQTGRQLYAALNIPPDSLLRPRDFVSVMIPEQPLRRVSTVPASAVSASAEMMLITPDNKLRAQAVRILRRIDDEVIISGLPADAAYVRNLLPQHGPGIPVTPVYPDAEMKAVEMITLDPETQARLIERITNNTRMPPFVKEGILIKLRSGRVTPEELARLEGAGGGPSNRPGGAGAEPNGPPPSAGATSPEMVTLSADRQAELLAKLETLPNLPDRARTRMAETISSGSAPAGLIARIEGGAE